MRQQLEQYTFTLSPLRTHHTLKGQTPSVVGTALGNVEHNKTRPNRANASIPNSSFINFCYTNALR
jgi:hypothetical protein